jgi:hypothetical protein
VSDQLSQVLAEGRPPVNGFLQRILDFVAALGGGGGGGGGGEGGGGGWGM